MPAEQEARVIANDAVEHDGWLDPVDMMRLARAYLALEAELLAAQERIAHLTQQRDGHAADRLAAEEREKALREALDDAVLDMKALGYYDRVGEYEKLLAGSPSEKPGSGQNHPPITSSNPKAKRELADAD